VAEQEHAETNAKDMKWDWALNRTLAAERLDTALVQEGCTPLGVDRRLLKDALGWWRICGSGQSIDNSRI